MVQSKNNLFYIFLIIFSVSSFIYGFTVREDSAGGGKYDFNNTWNNQKIFNENSLIDSLKNTKTGEIGININSHFPTSYILNKFLNPFSNKKKSFLKSIFILDFFLPIVFFLVLKNLHKEKNVYSIACFSSIIYLSPYFRTSSYWAGMENYGLFMLIISYYFFSKYLETSVNKKVFIFGFSLFSCLCVYFDQKLVFIPFIYMYLFIKNESDKNNLILYLIFNFILSIPVFLIIYYWGSLISPHDTITRSFGKLYLEQVGYCFSIISFYLIPYIVIFNKRIKQFLINNSKYFITITCVIITYIFLTIYFPTSYYGWDHIGKGWAHKFNKIIFVNIFSQNIFLYFIFFISILLFFAAAQKRLLLIFMTFFMVIASLLILPIFQEYFDPLIFIFLAFFFYKDNELNNNLVRFNYLFCLIFLIFNNFYY